MVMDVGKFSFEVSEDTDTMYWYCAMPLEVQLIVMSPKLLFFSMSIYVRTGVRGSREME